MFETVQRFFGDGGPFMAVLAALFAAAIVIIIERTYFYFVTCRGQSESLISEVETQLESGRPSENKNGLRLSTAPAASLLRTALDRHLSGRTVEQVHGAVEEEALRQVPRLQQRVDYLAVIANVATLAGLLGTIFGLQDAFASLAVADAATKASLLASGISQAMNTTAAGLMVAIPCMVAHAKLNSRRRELIDDLDTGALAFLNFLRARRSPRGEVGATPAAVSAMGGQS